MSRTSFLLDRETEVRVKKELCALTSESNKIKGQVNGLMNKYNMNRAQRRQEGKNNKNGKNRP